MAKANDTQSPGYNNTHPPTGPVFKKEKKTKQNKTKEDRKKIFWRGQRVKRESERDLRVWWCQYRSRRVPQVETADAARPSFFFILRNPKQILAGPIYYRQMNIFSSVWDLGEEFCCFWLWAK